MKKMPMITYLLLFLLTGCASSGTHKASPRWRADHQGVKVYLGGPPGGIRKVIGTIYAEGHNIEEAVEALAIEARRIRADAIYNVRESDLPGPPRRPGRPGNPNATSPGALAGDYRSERHIRSWRATAILLEPVTPTEREQPPETEKKKKTEDAPAIPRDPEPQDQNQNDHRINP